MRVFTDWSAGIAVRSINPTTQNRLWETLSNPPAIGTPAFKPPGSGSSSAMWHLIPAKADPPRWVCLADGPLVPDDAALAGLFADVPGVSYINLPASMDVHRPTASRAHQSR